MAIIQLMNELDASMASYVAGAYGMMQVTLPDSIATKSPGIKPNS